MIDNMQEILDKLRLPFHPSQVTWKPGVVKGDRALALAYADVRAYMNRLDEVCGMDWSVAYEPWGNDRLICRVTIGGIVRSSTGESTNESEKNEIGGTVAEAQAFKRACAMFGLGRYLYTLPTGWADFDPVSKRFTENAKFKLTGVLLQQYRRATGSKVEVAEIFEDGNATEPDNAVDAPENAALLEQFNALGHDLYGDKWVDVSRRNVGRISKNKARHAGELTAEQLQQLIKGMVKLKEGRTPMTNGVPA